MRLGSPIVPKSRFKQLINETKNQKKEEKEERKNLLMKKKKKKKKSEKDETRDTSP